MKLPSRHREAPPRYRLIAEVDEALYRAVELAARENYLSMAAFLRLAVLRQLDEGGKE